MSRKWKRLATRACSVAAVAGMAALGGVFGGVTPAQAAPATTMVYSTNGGSTWSTDVTAAPGSKVLARAYYSNDTTDAISGVSVTSSLPAGFTLVAGTTKACLNPGGTPTAPSTEQVCSSPLTDSAIWSGSNLTVSPTAGLYGQPTNLTTGMMAMGQKRYLNLHQCVYRNAAGDTVTTLVNDNLPGFDTFTNVSNTPTGPAGCEGGDASYTSLTYGRTQQALDLLGNRYLNLHQCNYRNAAGDTIMTYLNGGGIGWGTGTNTSNTANAPSATSCGAGDTNLNSITYGRYTEAFDLFGQRYLNLHQCYYTNTLGDTMTTITDDFGIGWGTGSNTSDSPDAPASAACDAGDTNLNSAAYLRSAQPIDLLDAARGQGFVEFSMMAPTPSVTTTYNQTGGTVGGVTTTDTGTITVTANPVPLTDPAVSGVALLAMAGAGLVVHRYRARKATAMAV